MIKFLVCVRGTVIVCISMSLFSTMISTGHLLNVYLLNVYWPSDVGPYHKLAVFLHVLDKASNE